MTYLEDAYVYAGAVGIEFTAETNLTAALVSSASKREIHYFPPIGAEVQKTATANGTKLVCTNDTPMIAGDYRFHAYLEWASGTKHRGKTFILTVEEDTS